MGCEQIERWIREGLKIWDIRLKIQVDNAGLLNSIRSRCAAEPKSFKLMGLEEEQQQALREANEAAYAAHTFARYSAARGAAA